MKKYIYLITAYLLLAVYIVGCSKNDNLTPPLVVDDTKIDNPINHFVWSGMNSWYNWQGNVSNLADSKSDDLKEYYTYLNGFSTPESLFNSLLFDKGNTDRFSWFIEDYVEQQQQFQGISKTTGIKRSIPVAIGNNQVIIYVQHVTVGSPADIAGIKRGDIINAIDNEIINETNYASVINKLYSGESILVSTAIEQNGTLSKVNDFSIAPAVVSDNPVFLTKTFDNINGKKVGYLVYNGFRSSFNDELNAAFATLKAEGVEELILDLRINGGGSVATSSYLASMIYANAGTDKFADLLFNSKHTNQSGSYDFQNELNVYDASGEKTGEETINRLTTINSLYVLASGSTASASEMIINGLKPFIPVKVIGTKTYGKNVGSITLFDSASSDFTSEASASSSHKNAMQPIVFQIFNKLGESDYTNGFDPDIEVIEYQYWNNILPFGDENEVVLKTALDDIRGLGSKSSTTLKMKTAHKLNTSKLVKTRFENEMYIDDDFFNQ